MNAMSAAMDNSGPFVSAAGLCYFTGTFIPKKKNELVLQFPDNSLKSLIKMK